MADMIAAPAVLRPLSPSDLPAAHALSSSFGWPHRLEDWRSMLGLGHGVAAECDGKLAGTAMRWLFGADWASIGLVGVAASAQGQGLGRRLAEAILDPVGERSILLHATGMAVPLYRSLGFEGDGVIRQMQGAAFGAGVTALASGERLRPIGRSDPLLLAALDGAATGMDRTETLTSMLASGVAVALDRGGEVIGFALLRRFGRGHVIGPVIAPDAGRAQALIGHFLASWPGQFMRVDVPEASGLCPWLEQLGLTDAGPAFRMVRGRKPQPSGPARPFALIGHAFG